MYAFSALMLLVVQQEGHPARKNFCIKNPCDGGFCKLAGYNPIDRSTTWVQRILACPVWMLRIKMTGDCESRGQLANPSVLGKCLLKWCIYIYYYYYYYYYY